MRNILNLTKIELIRIWSLGKIVTAIVMCLVACLLAVLPAIFSWINNLQNLSMPFTDYLIQFWKIVVPFSALFFSSGIISNDIKNHWLRSILVHSITREEIVFSKILSSLISVLIMMILLGIIPLILFSTSLGLGLNFKIINLTLVILLFTLEASLFITIATWLSCFLSGFMNVFLLAAWMFFDNIIMKGVMSLWLNNTFSGTLILDFFFPSGFSEAAVVASSTGAISFENILWGFAALSFFLSLAFFHFNKLTIDVNSD